jgi:alpha-galactosidase
MNKKIVCLGGGSWYFRGALGDVAVMEGLRGSEITLYDLDYEKSQIMAEYGSRLTEKAGTGMRVRACKDLADAVDGADFAISSIGGSGASLGGVYGTPAHVADMIIPARYGVYQIIGDTTGPAGMMMGLRSIPAYISICREMEKRCPKVILMSHSNPMAILCRAMIKYTGIQVIGICHGVQGGIMHVAGVLGVSPHELDTVWIGTNHYYWFTRICNKKGEDLYPEFWRKEEERGPVAGQIMTSKLSRIYGYQITYPPDDHVIEFYSFPAQIPDGKSIPYGLLDHVHGTRYEKLELEKEPELSDAEKQKRRQSYMEEYRKGLETLRLPDGPSDPLTGEGLGSLIENIALGRRRVHIVNIPNRGAIPNLPEHAIMEIEGVTDSCGVRGIHAGEAPLSLKGLMEKRIAWHELVVEAGVKGDRNLALQALLLDEMAIMPEKAEAMLDELLAASKDLLPQFEK